jgi:outer membrane protease
MDNNMNRMLFGIVFFLISLNGVFTDEMPQEPPVPAQAQAKAASVFNWEFQTAFGIKSAQTREYVYQNGKQISRLDWTDYIAPFAAFSTLFSVFNITAGAGISLSIPVQSGIMEDYDFLIAGSDAASLYSRHDSYLDKDFSCYAELGYVFKIKTFYIFPAAGFCYENRKWSAADGYLQYPASGAWTGSEPKENVYGTVISYEQAVWHPALSLCAGYIYKQIIDVSLYGKFYPYLWSESIDSHFLREPPVRFYDTLKGGIGGKFGLQTAFSPAKGIALVLSIEYEMLTSAKGASSSGTIGKGNGVLVLDEAEGAKMERGAFAASLGVRVKG